MRLLWSTREINRSVSLYNYNSNYHSNFLDVNVLQKGVILPNIQIKKLQKLESKDKIFD